MNGYDFSFVSRLLTGERGSPTGNRFAGTCLGELPIPFPKNYVLGIDVQRKDFEQYSRPSYLRGEFRETGWWYYYLYALGIKVPLGTWGLHPAARPLYLAYFGYFDPAHIGLVFSAPAAVTDGHDRPVDPAGVYAISVNFLYGFPSFLSDGQGGKTWYARDALVRFRRTERIGSAGHSIYIFRISPAT